MPMLMATLSSETSAWGTMGRARRDGLMVLAGQRCMEMAGGLLGGGGGVTPNKAHGQQMGNKQWVGDS